MFSNDQDAEMADRSAPIYQLQSSDYEEILNVIDQLRSEGISRYVNIPQLIVCGDQSSGKSSVLEAISGFKFPAKDNVCTRFPTELILRRNAISSTKISIHPDPERPEKEKHRLQAFEPEDMELESFAEIVKNAGKAMRVNEKDIAFSKDILRVEVRGPSQPNLTLVDLPGLYHAPDEQQDVRGIEYVESMVREYMANTRSVILAVMSAKNEVALQKVTLLTYQFDPEGIRTLGIITKPDTLSGGSETERSFFSLAQNKKVKFRLGWHVLKNRTHEELELDLAARNESETRFLSQGIWGSLPREQVGIHNLIPRLSNVLKNHVLSQMPSFIEDTQVSLYHTKMYLQNLGPARQTLAKQRKYLIHGSHKFSTLVNSSLNGIYLDPFFGNTFHEDGDRKRLRAVIQYRLFDFSDTMKLDGQDTEIVDDGMEYDRERTWKYRTDFVEEVRKIMRCNRGRELPGNFNPLIVGELFYRQAQPWESIVEKCVAKLLKDVRASTVLMLNEVLDPQTVSELLKRVVNDQLSEIEKGLRVKTVELLKPQQAGHPITYNSQYVDTIQEIRDQHLRESITKKLQTFFGKDYPTNPNSDNQYYFRMQGLIDSISSRTETDMERFACSEAIDCMQAYYQVAMRKFIDDFANLAVEKCLLEPLANVFSPETVDDMADEDVEAIAREDEHVASERKQLEDKLEVLSNSLRRLQQLDQYSTKDLSELHTEHGAEDDEDEEGVEKISNERSSSPVSVARLSEGLGDLQPETQFTIDVAETEEKVEPAQSPKTRRKKHSRSSFFE